MPYGMLTCCFGVFLGGLLGSWLKNYISDSVRQTVPMIVGLTAICSGFVSVVKATHMPVVTFAVIVGGWIGHNMESTNFYIVKTSLNSTI